MPENIPENQSPSTELGDIDQSLNETHKGFVEDAPNLPFKLPFGLNKFFRFKKRLKQRKSFRAP